MPDTPSILLNGTPRSLAGAAPTTTLLDWLRGPATAGMGGLTGTTPDSMSPLSPSR